MTTNQLEKIPGFKFYKKICLSFILYLIRIKFFTKSFEIKPVFNFTRKSFILQLDICLKRLDHVTALLVLLTVAKYLMPFTGV